MDYNYKIKSNKYVLEDYRHFSPVMTLGNGYLGCRGFFEENQSGIDDLGGIYLSGIFGWANYIPWSGKGHELVNAPNCFKVTILINDKVILMNQNTMRNFQSELDMKLGYFSRSYEYCDQEISMKFQFKRFVSMATKELLGQSIEVQNQGCDVKVKLDFEIKDDVTNLNEVSSEPCPIQPGKKQFDTIVKTKDYVQVRVKNDKQDEIVVAQSFDKLPNAIEKNSSSFEFNLVQDEQRVVKRLIAITSTRYHKNPNEDAMEILRDNVFDDAFEQHTEKLSEKWQQSDVVIEGNDEDQLSLRYNIFQLMQACPGHDERLSIGARGLTGEMYEGCIFWDTEIFMLPFFIFTNPEAARKLLMYRYHTLPQARKNAKANYFNGAMYGWQVNEAGEEQTPQGVGAYYSIHVIADIAYAISQYWYATRDIEFMKKYGMEILIETARFWKSRVQKDLDSNKYHILGVRGPNEYDVIVNNNTYTNLMAIQNLILCKDFMREFEKIDSDFIDGLKNKIDFKEDEVNQWEDLIENIYVPYRKEQKLYLEDDCYHLRRRIDINDYKKTKKRIIDTTIPYEALTMYQISKQADVLHAMINLPWIFSEEEIKTAWDYYVPRTCFDSSLSYSIHALIGARINEMEHSLEFYRKSANLDINNQQLNTISGLHLANFGGTWQSVALGFAGIVLNPDKIVLNPQLPKEWKEVSFNFIYHGHKYHLKVNQHEIIITGENSGDIFEYHNNDYHVINQELRIRLENEDEKI